MPVKLSMHVPLMSQLGRQICAADEQHLDDGIFCFGNIALSTMVASKVMNTYVYLHVHIL